VRGWETRFFDGFDNNVVDIQQDPANGAITEPVGTDLVLSITAGQHAGWGGGTGNDNKGCPIAFEAMGDHAEFKGLMRFETRVTGLVKTGNEIFAGLTVFNNRGNAYLVGWYDANDYFYLYKMVDDVGRTELWKGGYYGDPTTTPHVYRLYVNATDERVNLEESTSWSLNPFSIGFVLSSNDGSSWVYPHQRTLEFAPTKVGLYALNWSTTWRGVDASFDYLKFEQNLEPVTVIGDQNVDSQPQTSGAVEASGRRLESERTPSVGLGPTIETIADVRQIDYEEHAGLGYGTHLPSDGGQFEDVDLGQVVDADIMVEKEDSDGESMLTSGEVVDVFLIDTTTGSFGNPVANDHWGAAKDGQFYANGLVCGPGDFGTVIGGFRTSAWRFSGQDPHGLQDGTTVFSLVADDQLRIQGTWPAWASPGGIAHSYHRWVLETGDFDIQVDFLNYVVNAGSEGESRLAVTAHGPGGTNQFYINRDANGTYRTARVVDSGYASLGTVGTSDTSGKLRITRVSGVLTAYKWNGSGWDQVGATYSHANLNGEMHVNVGSSGNNNTNTDITFSNFTINVGTTTSRAGWYRESSGADRGTQQSMPDSLVAVCSEASVTLVDLANNKMWMRFIRSGNNALHYYSSYGQRPWKVKWSNGLLMIAHGSSPTQSEEGGAIWVDFTWDQIRIHRQAVSTVCGGYYGGTGTKPNGQIALRNGNYSYSGDYDEWAILDYRVYDVDILHAGDYEYRAVCCNDGIRMFKVKRWYPLDPVGLENSSGPESSRMVWCEIDKTDGELFYMDATTLYSRDKTGAGQGWEDWMTGGVWAAQYSKALPGTRQFEFQLRPARIEPYIFLPAIEGVYRVDWPTGSWELFYGKVGSGATHEVLPDYDMVVAVAVGQDDLAESLLVVATAKDNRGQEVAIKLSDDTVYGRAKKADLKVPSVVTA
jgi:hypothetical protein